MSTGSVLSSTPKPKPPTSRQGFVDVDKLENSSGLVAVISQRSANGTLTFAIFREFMRDGHVDRTGFVPEDLGSAYLEMAQLAIDRMKVLRAGGGLPFAVTQAR